MIKKGDKVRFLNSVGGGIVRGFRDKHTAWVEDESGFEFPVSVSECVVVDEGGGTARNSLAAREERSPAVEPAEPPVRKEPEEYRVEETPEGERLNLSIAYLLVDPKNLTSSGYEAYLVNDSNYYLYYNYMSASNRSWTSRSSGLIEPNTRIFMEEFGKEDLNDLERICVQLIAFKKKKPYALKNALSVELRLDTVKFYKIHCFTANDFFDDDALILPLVRNDVPERPLLVSATDLQEAMMEKKRDDRRKPQPVSKPKAPEAPILEIDLHISQLLDDTTGMSASDMLHYQLDKFHAVMQEHTGQKGRKIVFIHGKGEGVLRAAIEKELKTRYKSCDYQDASFREYGFGATMVKIR